MDETSNPCREIRSRCLHLRRIESELSSKSLTKVLDPESGETLPRNSATSLHPKNDCEACNLFLAADVFFTRAHCPSGGLSPRRGRAGMVSLPCRLAAGATSTFLFFAPRHSMDRAALLAGENAGELSRMGFMQSCPHLLILR